MSKDPAFLFYAGDYLRDTQTLSEKSQVAYDRIMCEHMRNICISKQQLKFFTKRLDDDEKEELLMVLTEYKAGNYQITWVAESIIKRRNYSESRRQNRLSNTKKVDPPSEKEEEKEEEHMNNICKTYDEHMENENENESVNKVLDENKILIFELFWDQYDKKISRKNCLAKWMKLEESEIVEIMNTLDIYVASTPDIKYRKNPLTYLNQRSWEDEIKVEQHERRI